MTSNGVPAIDSHQSKLKYVGLFSQHAKDWVENNVEDGAGNNIDLNNDDGVTAEDLSNHFSTYYNNYLHF